MVFRYITKLTVCFCVSLVTAQNPNEDVLTIANSFSGGGYKWSSTGVPKSIYFKDSEILAKSEEGTFCSGYTFTVAFDALEKRGLIKNLTVDQIKWLQKNWYGTNDVSAETQCLYSLEKLGLGKKVDHSDAQAGDFVQFWRNNKSGHSVIFLDWVRDHSGKITGIKYRSTQKSTNGIGDRTETIGSGDRDISIQRLYIVRLNPAN